MRAGVWLLVAVGCSSQHLAAPDASFAASRDAFVGPHHSCTRCTQLPFAADYVYDVAADGTTIFVSFTPPGSSQIELASVPVGGGTLTPIVDADDVVLVAFEDAVFYATLSGNTYEVHQRSGTTDTILGTVSSRVPIVMAANSTDVYVLADFAAETTLWRLSRAGGVGSTTVTNGVPKSITLGSTVAVLRTNITSTVTSIPGPSIASQVELDTDPLVFSGDVGFDVVESDIDSKTRDYSIAEFGLEGSTFEQGGEFFDVGSVEGTLIVPVLRVDAKRLYWVVVDGEDSYLSTGTLDKNSHATLGNWPSLLDQGVYGPTTLEQDATHLYGLEPVAQDQWVIDVLAKP